ncbi:hypothetical protein [Natrarchaeobaculum sulfurireducens]|uniref:Uncharacterized protein n=1 Tax=Natrarchaeobaculum sulfurireducens TaxID=2044521 RepID=A0A346PR35_9EURY|nr:hypothetical protein [Natrarchaeobaculum sulfurireducens]AXR78031.1 hypothetical protein AArc1_1703 [Natrarchaeobaculum sulfurireducens]AXR81980.1 hypothetical protein AArcMg_1977 [Natrarchaeobaculum sulfurireducens]
MNRWVLIGIVAILLVFVGVATTFVLPLSVDSTSGPFEFGQSDSYVSSGEISAENERLLVVHEATVLDDEAHFTFEYENGTVEQFYDDGTVYTKYEGHVDDEEWMASTEPTDAEEVYFGEHEDRFVRITEENGTVDPSEMQFVRVQTGGHLDNPEYEHVEEQDNRTVYEPSSTWTTFNTGTRHVSPKSGKLSVDRETGVLREASLRYQLTGASSYGEYLLRPGNTTTVNVQYEYDPGPSVDDIETPTWVEQCVENDHCEF